MVSTSQRVIDRLVVKMKLNFAVVSILIVLYHSMSNASVYDVRNYGAFRYGEADDAALYDLENYGAFGYVQTSCADAIVYDVTEYGAVGDGETNDAEAFEKAWDKTCKNGGGSAILLVPEEKTFLVYPINFTGPCRASNVIIQVLGSVVAPTEKSAWTECSPWISFHQIPNLIVKGSGGFDARGETWWTGSLKGACSKHNPTSLKFDGCDNLIVSDIHSKNSPKNHFSITGSTGVTVSNIRAIAPGTSPNTDGIDISHSSGVHVKDSLISTGDDCIAINNNCKDIYITNIECGPGHGISVGSLGKDGDQAAVEGVHVRNCSFKGSQNGARIKTWKGGKGYARSIRYENITLEDVEHPLYINQHYVDKHALLGEDSAVKISDVTFSGFRGTSAKEFGIQLECAPEGPGCINIVIKDVNITTLSGAPAGVNCTNAHGKSVNTSPEVTCLSSYYE